MRIIYFSFIDNKKRCKELISDNLFLNSSKIAFLSRAHISFSIEILICAINIYKLGSFITF